MTKLELDKRKYSSLNGGVNAVPQLNMVPSPCSSFGSSGLGASGGPWTPLCTFPALLQCREPVAMLAAEIRKKIDGFELTE